MLKDDNPELDLLKAKLYNNLANAHRRMRDFDNSFKYYSYCLKLKDQYTYSIACFNLGSMLLEKGDLLPAITYLDKANSSDNKLIIEYLDNKGICYLLQNEKIKEAIYDYFKSKFNNSVIKLKSIYLKYENNPIVNFFLGYNYTCLKKFDKSSLFFEKLLKLNEKFIFENKPFLRKIIKKTRLISNKIKDLDDNINESYIAELLNFEDFPVLSAIDEYVDVFEESVHNKINTQLNIILSTKRGYFY
jgi:tetratricopeptide (TPR) repeat protein